VDDGVSGLLIDGHRPASYAEAISTLLADDEKRAAFSTGAVTHASTFSWDRTVEGVLRTYEDALTSLRLQREASISEMSAARRLALSR
ncbi:MAG: D-inositol-3-phosphate glycosyltransferase, partial [Acidothermaceae bacterium]